MKCLGPSPVVFKEMFLPYVGVESGVFYRCLVKVYCIEVRGEFNVVLVLCPQVLVITRLCCLLL